MPVGETYQQTDVDFLDSERDAYLTYRDDGSTASTALLVGNHLYVANVGDSRTILSKAGKGIPCIFILFLLHINMLVSSALHALTYFAFKFYHLKTIMKCFYEIA